MLSEPLWLDVATAIRLNQEAVRRTGEPYGLRDQGLLESALANPANSYHYGGVDDLAMLGATLMVSVARDHPFQQGNKRTAFALGLAFLDVNGFRVTLDTRAFADLFVAVIEHTAEVEALAQAVSDGLTEKG